METVFLLDVFDREIRCEYKNRVYFVRDNGAVYRQRKLGCPASKWDDVWTFGMPNDKTGYMEIAGERVHRIIAFAFHGNPPTDQHVVDHIDTNRRNNRPENLRWVTRLENALNNPITRARIINICGSIEAFLLDPSVLHGHERQDPKFHWMRTVTREEAHNSLERLTDWAKEPTKSQGGSLGEWVFQRRSSSMSSNIPMQNQSVSLHQSPETEVYESLFHDEETQSLTPNAVQVNWKKPTEFLCCPQHFSDNPLEAYLANLKEGKIFCKNEFGISTVLRYGIYNNSLWIMCDVRIGWKTHAFTKITFREGIFYHHNEGLYDIADEPDNIFDKIINGEKE